MKKLFFFFLLGCLGLLTSCGTKAPSLDGHWINAGQFMLSEKDTLWDRIPLVWHFDKEGRFAAKQSTMTTKGLAFKTDSSSWQLQKDAKAFVIDKNGQKEAWLIEYLGQDSLVVRLDKQGPKVYWVFARMLPKTSPAISLEAVRTFMYGNILQAEAATVKKVNGKPLQIECFQERFIYPNVPQTLYLPMMWGLFQVNEQPLILLQSTLSGVNTSFDAIEVEKMDGYQLIGRYFLNGKAHSIRLFPFTEVPSEIQRKNLMAELIGDWKIEVADKEVLPSAPPPVPEDFQGKIQPYETLSLSANGDFSNVYYHYEYKGQWWQSRTGHIVIMRNGHQFNYLTAGEIKGDTVLVVRRNLSTSFRDAVTKLVKQKVLQ